MDSSGGEDDVATVVMPPLDKKRDKKYVQGPKLKILPSQLERPESPPILLSLYDSFSKLRQGDKAAKPSQEQMLEEASAAERRALFPIVVPSHGALLDEYSDEFDDVENVLNRHAQNTETVEDGAARRGPDTSWKKAYDPWSVHEKAGFNRKKAVWGSRLQPKKQAPQRGDDSADEDDGKRHRNKAKRSKTAPGVAAEGKKKQNVSSDRADLEKVLELAEMMLVGNTPTNRLESALYGGSEDLTFPCVRINQDDVLEITHKRGGELRKMKWNEHAEARVCGVLAMKGLMLRHHDMKQRKQELETAVASMKLEVQQAVERVTEMEKSKDELAEELKDMQTKLRKTEAAMEREKAARQREVLKLNDTIKEQRTALEAAFEERDGLQIHLTQTEDSLKKQTDMVATLRKELVDKQVKERDDASRLARVMQDATKDVLEKERLEHELEMLNDDFEYCRKKLTSCAEYKEKTHNEYEQKIRRVEMDLNTKVARMQQELEQQTNARQELEDNADRIRKERQDAIEKADMLEESLDRAIEQRTLMQEEKDKMGVSNDKLNRKVKWTYMICLVLLQKAFPPNEDFACQSSSAPHLVSVGTSTQGGSSGGADMTDFWASVRRQARRLELKGKDASLRMSLTEMLTLIASCYMRKSVADLLDDKQLKPRQTLVDFLYVMVLEDTQDTKEAVNQMCRIVANLEMYCNLASAGPANMPRKGFGPAVGTDKRRASVSTAADSFLHEDPEHVLNAVPRIVLFARFLGLDTGGYQDSIPLEGLNVFLALVVKIRKGHVPLTPTTGEKEIVNAADVLEAMDFVFARLSKHAKVEMKLHFQKEVCNGKAEVDLDSALVWLTDSFKVNVYDKTEEMLRGLFLTYDDNENADLEFAEFVQMISKLKLDHRDLLPTRQLLRMYCKMLLNTRVDSNVFVRVAKEFGLCAFNVGPYEDDVHDEAFKDHHLVEEATDQWRQMEGHVTIARKFKEGTSLGFRLDEQRGVLTLLLEEGLHPEMTKVLLSCVAADAGLNVPAPLRAYEKKYFLLGNTTAATKRRIAASTSVTAGAVQAHQSPPHPTQQQQQQQHFQQQQGSPRGRVNPQNVQLNSAKPEPHNAAKAEPNNVMNSPAKSSAATPKQTVQVKQVSGTQGGDKAGDTPGKGIKGRKGSMLADTSKEGGAAPANAKLHSRAQLAGMDDLGLRTDEEVAQSTIRSRSRITRGATKPEARTDESLKNQA